MDFLVVDDDQIFREATCLLIEEEGHFATSASTGEVALERIKEDKFDAIAASELAVAAPVLADLIDAQFNADSSVDVASVSDSAEELIRTWS